jgi:hypothetical protein
MKKKPTTRRLPATFIEAEEQIIVAAIARWRAEREPLLSSEASNQHFENVFLRHLRAGGTGCFSAAYIVEIARNGHPPADRAVRTFIQEHMEKDQFQALPVSVREFARESLWRPALALGYPSRAPQVLSNLMRDLALCLAINKVVQQWPQVPLLHPTAHRRSAADLAGEAFGMSEWQARRLYQTPGELARKLFDFLWMHRADDPELFAGYR